jgi:2-C-methyl-D-erythritol 4-phosphate cytidylyltransferase
VPILGHALRGALSCPDLREVVVVAPPAWLGQAQQVCRSAGLSSPLTVVPGGAERGDSVAAGLAALSEAVRVVLVHDAARCLAPASVYARVVEAVRGGAAAAVPGVAVVDTIKEIDGCGRVVATPDRSRLRAVQTPQGFSRAVLERAHALTSDATDDAALVERLGEPVLVVEGDDRALKITTREDLDRAARILAG